jgi:hypothetical protein
MVEKASMKHEVFLDTAYAIALSAPGDLLHNRAVTLAEQLEAERTRLLTTVAVLLEIGNGLAKMRYRAAAVKLLRALRADPSVVIIPMSDQLLKRAFQLYYDRPDKEWGLTDCVSFIAMKDHGTVEALTADEHFQEAGFRALMRDVSP